MPNIPFSDAIAARVGPEYGLGSDVARSLVREVLKLATAERPSGWSHDDFCPPEELRRECCNDCATCYEAATEAMKEVS